MAQAKAVGFIDGVAEKAMAEKEMTKRNRQRNASFKADSLHIRVRKDASNLKHSPFAGLKENN